MQMSFSIEDLRHNIEGFEAAANGGVFKKIALLDGSLFSLDSGARRGLNKITIRPLYFSTKEEPFRIKERTVWSGAVELRQSVRVHPQQIVEGLSAMISVEEEMYFHLRRFDSLLRALPEEGFPKPFLADFADLPRRVEKSVRSVENDRFFTTLNDFYIFAYGKKTQSYGLFIGAGSSNEIGSVDLAGTRKAPLSCSYI